MTVSISNSQRTIFQEPLSNCTVDGYFNEFDFSTLPVGTYQVAIQATNAGWAQNFYCNGSFCSAPIVNPITVTPSPVQQNSPITATATFTDQNVSNTHYGIWDWGDGSESN